MLLELQVPQAPWPADPHGPQALPQQNQDISPLMAVMCYLPLVEAGVA
jgi:hypothetical protein